MFKTSVMSIWNQVPAIELLFAFKIYFIGLKNNLKEIKCDWSFQIESVLQVLFQCNHHWFFAYLHRG
jgi:hypothetical protein